MAFKFNVFTSNFDIVEAGSSFWLDPVPTRADLPSGVADGAAINVLDEESIFVYEAATDEWHNTRLSLELIFILQVPQLLEEFLQILRTLLETRLLMIM